MFIPVITAVTVILASTPGPSVTFDYPIEDRMFETLEECEADIDTVREYVPGMLDDLGITGDGWIIDPTRKIEISCMIPPSKSA
jgi:hypothetical protein